MNYKSNSLMHRFHIFSSLSLTKKNSRSFIHLEKTSNSLNISKNNFYQNIFHVFVHHSFLSSFFISNYFPCRFRKSSNQLIRKINEPYLHHFPNSFLPSNNEIFHFPFYCLPIANIKGKIYLMISGTTS